MDNRLKAHSQMRKKSVADLWLALAIAATVLASSAKIHQKFQRVRMVGVTGIEPVTPTMST